MSAVTPVIVIVTALLAAACVGDDPERAGAETPAAVTGGESPAAESTDEGASPVATLDTAPGAFALDLRTGETTPLPETLPADVFVFYTASPDGSMLAYTTCSGPYCGSLDVLTIVNTDGTDARVLEAPEGLMLDGAQWSADGTKLVYQARHAAVRDIGNLFVHDLASGVRTQITDLQVPPPYWWFITPSFSHDGRSVVYHLPRTGAETTRWDVWSVPATGGKSTLLLRDASFPMFFPDGRRIAFVVPSPSDFSGHRIEIASADGRGSRRTLVRADGAIWFPTMSPDGTRIAYAEGGSIHVVDVSTGESTNVAEGSSAEWLDDRTLIVSP